MPQAQLPIFPTGTTKINHQLAFERRDDQVTYFHELLPVFQHDVNDNKTFHLIVSQFYVNGNATQAQICRAFDVTKISLKRAVKPYREKGPSGFYDEPKRRGAAVLTAPVLVQVQQLLDEGVEVVDATAQVNIKADTLRKAVAAGKLHKAVKKTENNVTPLTLSSKSERNQNDAQAPMGMGATNSLDRVAASVGLLNGVEPHFETGLDIPQAGVLFALPALLANGLLKSTENFFTLPKGYYRLDSLFLLMAFMALARVKNIEALRYKSPGEWGRLLGLDHIPEAKTLRKKIDL